ncbi:MAG: hypothetical protein HGA44_08285 [Cellulomonadaceae bacterium]|nr:hypothetical protein [Cellulomonadaceae bacterium]
MPPTDPASSSPAARPATPVGPRAASSPRVALDPQTARPWLVASAVAAVIALVGSLVALLDVAGTYGEETASFVDQAVAQDTVNLVVVAPATLVLTWLARRGSTRAGLLWLGVLTFTVYNYVIYTFSIHVGPLFLVWVAVLSLSLWSFVGGLRSVHVEAAASDLTAAPRRLVGWFLVVVAVLFTLLWLKDIVPAVLDGRVPTGAADLGLPSNPVHVLDLAIFLPAVLAVGRLVLLRRPAGVALAPVALVFLILTGLPILVTPLTTSLRGGDPVWAASGPVGVLTVAALVVLGLTLRRATAPTPGPVG